MIIERILPFAKTMMTTHVHTNSTVIDATCGNGLDTTFLAQLVPNGHVYACDIQSQAIVTTRQRTAQYSNVSIIQTGHEKIIDYIQPTHLQSLDGAMFNLGYLPKGDKSIVTRPETTIVAIEQILKHLRPKGIIVLAVYPGHEEGRIESEHVKQYVQQIDQQQAHVLQYSFINQQNHPPYIIAIEKRG
ncbi:class I SAM-dependent methyltransferase [Staphylococcus sp. 17KM0847]|uniref:tRNA (mnm(5)s(2)U34)-methyltransferase n=1 Tax=Staphylococcus sp. 17KM0847 TaxID=2583989 RepID=UPI0015DC7819|nr:class I SAM-dependent methyltransferase [Staphylococcus sp. 17KM0847]QLK86296.1 methyltransferase domain-containing protein [Staphylococcus sp. 17KM0847]